MAMILRPLCVWVVLFAAAALAAQDQLISMDPPSQAESPRSRWEGDATEPLSRDGKPVTTLPTALLQACLGSERVTGEESANNWRRHLFRPGYEYDAEPLPNRTVRLPMMIPGATDPVLWIPDARTHCLMDRLPTGWKLLAREVDPAVEPAYEATEAVETKKSMDKIGFPHNFAWEQDSGGSIWRLLLYSNGGWTGVWLADTFSLSSDGRRIERIGHRVGSFSAFDQLHVNRLPDHRLLLWSESEELGNSHYCNLFSQAGGSDRYDNQRKIIKEELRLGRRMGEDEAMRFLGGEALACLGGDRSKPPSADCFTLGREGIKPQSCAEIPEFAASIGWNNPGQKTTGSKPTRAEQPRSIAAKVEEDPRSGLAGDHRWAVIAPEKLNPSDQYECLSGTPGVADVYLEIPYAFPTFNNPTVILSGNSLCLFGSGDEQAVIRLQRLQLAHSLSAINWVAWLPGSTVRYRYLLIEAKRRTKIPSTEMHLFRLDLAKGSIIALDSLPLRGNWQIRSTHKRHTASDEDEGLLITNFNPDVSAETINECLLAPCGIGDLDCQLRCAHVTAEPREMIIVDHNKFVRKPYTPEPQSR